MAASRVQSPYSSLDWGNVLAEVNTEDGGSENDDSENDNYEALRGLTLRQLNEAKDVRKIHRSLAYRPINAVEKLAKEGYLINMPIDVGQFVENGQVKVIYCPTKDMIADILTKPLGVSQFLYLRDYLLGYKIPAKGCVMGK